MADSSNPGFRPDDARQGENASGANGASRGRTGSRRGFAAMDPARQREIASKGGKAAHQKGTAHEWSADEAREAGRKGGVAVSRDRAHMAAIGREGGGARGAARRKRMEEQQRTSTTSAGSRSDREQAINVSREMGGAGASAGNAGSAGGSRDESLSTGLGNSLSGEERQGSAGAHRDTGGRSDDRL